MKSPAIWYGDEAPYAEIVRATQQTGFTRERAYGHEKFGSS
jgi:hypothetical protein